jgi:amino acid permease
VALGLTTTRFDVAYCVALFLAIDSCSTLVLGGIPEGSATERALGWTAFAVIMIAPVVLWRTRNSSAGPHLQSAFIILAAVAIIVRIVFS